MLSFYKGKYVENANSPKHLFTYIYIYIYVYVCVCVCVCVCINTAFTDIYIYVALHSKQIHIREIEAQIYPHPTAAIEGGD